MCRSTIFKKSRTQQTILCSTQLKIFKNIIYFLFTITELRTDYSRIKAIFFQSYFTVFHFIIHYFYNHILTFEEFLRKLSRTLKLNIIWKKISIQLLERNLVVLMFWTVKNLMLTLTNFLRMQFSSVLHKFSLKLRIFTKCKWLPALLNQVLNIKSVFMREAWHAYLT